MSNVIRNCVIDPFPLEYSCYFERKTSKGKISKKKEMLLILAHFEYHKQRNYPLEFNFQIIDEKQNLIEKGQPPRLYSGKNIPVTCKFLMNNDLEIVAHFPIKKLGEKLTHLEENKKIDTTDSLVFYMLNFISNSSFSLEGGGIVLDYHFLFLHEVILKSGFSVPVTDNYCTSNNNFSKDEKLEIFRKTLEKCKSKMQDGKKYLDESLLGLFIAKQQKILEDV